MTSAEIKDRLIRLNVQNARATHRIAVWAEQQYREFGWPRYVAMAHALRKDAQEFLDTARRIKAGAEADMGEAA